MSAQNGYAQLVVRGDDTNVIVFPPKEGGAPMDVNRLVSYLEKNLLNQYDLKQLSEACKSTDCEMEVRVGIAPFRAFNETMEMEISADKMLVFCRFYPASEGGDRMDEQEIATQMQQNKIKFGIDHEAICRFLSNREYNKEIVLAKGKPPRQGKDAKIEYFFNTSLNTKPKKNPDGTVDYHELNTVSMVQAGQRLARLIPPDHGEDGMDVLGNIIKPRSVKELKLEFGNNITLSEDRSEITSDVTGHATLTGGKVFVSDVLEIPADVDTSTGDINYDGSVLIKGNVKSGFRVVANGDVVVEGVVEGAVIQSKGQIVIKQGIHGMNKGILSAHGNIICKFIENATVTCGGYLETEGILHSKVSAFSEIHVHGRKSLVTGGTIRAGYLLDTEVLGSEMGAITQVEVGVDPAKKAKYLDMQKNLAEKKKNIDTMKPILTNFSEKMAAGVQLPQDKLEYVQKLAVAFKKEQAELMGLKEEIEVLHSEIMAGSDARVKVSKNVYPGVTVTISDVSLTIRDTRGFCQFVREGGEVVVKNL